MLKPTLTQATQTLPRTGTLCLTARACIPHLHSTCPGPPVISSRALESEWTIPGRACWSKELSRALIHDLILRRAITQSPVLFLAAKCKQEMGYIA